MGIERSLPDLLRNNDYMTTMFDLYGPALYKYALRLVHDPIEADNIVGDVFSQLLDEIAAGRGPRTNLRSYLYQTAYHLVVDRYRDNKHIVSLNENMADIKNAPSSRLSEGTEMQDVYN